MKIFILLKRNILTMLFGSFLACLVLFSKNNLSAAKDGLTLWATCVVPSLFPFFIATELLNYTNIINIFGKFLSKVMRPTFNIPGEGAYPLIMGIISGSPIGAKIVSDLYNQNKCTKNEAERMLAFTNNSGPLFVIGTVGILLFGNSTIGILLFVTHVLSAISVGIVYGFSSRLHVNSSNHHLYRRSADFTHDNFENSISNLGEIMAASISQSVTTILQIGGFVVLFSVILSILNRLNIITGLCSLLSAFGLPSNFSCGFLSGIIELTNGVSLISKIHTKIISNCILICSFLLGFGGFSILLQVLSIISKYNLSIKKYFYGKLLQGVFAVFYTALFIKIIPLYNFDLPTSSSVSVFSQNAIWIALGLLISFIFTIFLKQKKNCDT